MYAGTLGRIFRNKVSDFPKNNYLKVDSDKLKKIKNKVDNISKLYKIGITWNSKRELIGQDKSISLRLLNPILKIEDFTFINLQYGDIKKDLDEYNKKKKNKIYQIEKQNRYNQYNYCDLNLFLGSLFAFREFKL